MNQVGDEIIDLQSQRLDACHYTNRTDNTYHVLPYHGGTFRHESSIMEGQKPWMAYVLSID